MIKAVIFDLNGTVIDDEWVYGKAFNDVLSQFGVTNSEDPHETGIGVAENWPILIDRFDIKTDKPIEELALLTNQSYLSKISEVTLTNGFEEFIQTIREAGMQAALATSNTWGMVEKVFERFEIEQYFDFVTTKEEVANMKPSPEIFLMTADKLSLEPSECVVVEDSNAGIEAAISAKMKCIAINNHSKLANLNILDFDEITLDDVLKLEKRGK